MRTRTNTQMLKTLGLSLVLAVLSFQSSFAEVTYLEYLYGQEFEMGNLLGWSTELEANSEIFVIERSEDGSNFVEIGSIDAAGNSDTENAYNFLDIGAKEEKSFYRLRQMDLDGTTSYSHTIIVNKVLLNQFAVVNMSTTEVKDLFTFNVESTVDADLEIFVKSYAGDMIAALTQPMFEGLNEFSVPMKEYEEGIYKIFLKCAEEEESVVLLKLEDKNTKKLNFASIKKTKDFSKQ